MKVTILYSADDIGSYPRDDFRGAIQLVAQSLIKAVAANSDALMLYATLINGKAFDSASTLDPFQIPAIAAYNNQMATAKKQLDALKQQVSADAVRLVNLNSAMDHTATSVWGCLQLARTRFQHNPGTQYLVIASDLENTTSVDYTADYQETRA